MTRQREHERGFSILLVLGAIATLAIITLLVLNQYTTSRSRQIFSNIDFQATILTQNLARLVEDPVAWSNTRRLNPTVFACLITPGNCATSNPNNAPPANTYPWTAPGGNFAIYDRDANLVYDSTNPTQGFNMAGVLCNKFSATNGSDQCPFHPVLYWVPTCSVTPCNSYVVYGYVVYNPTGGSLSTGTAAKTGTTIYAHSLNAATTSVTGTSNVTRQGYNFHVVKNESTTGTVTTISNQAYCCSIGCAHQTETTGPGMATVTLSIFSQYNCYPGSPEVPNDLCSKGILAVPYSLSWFYNGVSSVSSTACPQGSANF